MYQGSLHQDERILWSDGVVWKRVDHALSCTGSARQLLLEDTARPVHNQSRVLQQTREGPLEHSCETCCGQTVEKLQARPAVTEARILLHEANQLELLDWDVAGQEEFVVVAHQVFLREVPSLASSKIGRLAKGGLVSGVVKDRQ
mmetsp:Transcript_60005/g.194557  ORF Transcript_60005/g.194557 Transcript_60005/m.194557 type:complete len:145 (-) Transcript_60005:85-519(-)